MPTGLQSTPTCQLLTGMKIFHVYAEQYIEVFYNVIYDCFEKHVPLIYNDSVNTSQRNGFCRAMLCISAAIAGMRCLSVCPSVCLSDTFVSCAKTNKDIFKNFSPSGSQAILVFPYQTGWRSSDGNPFNRGVECNGGIKNDDFRPISRSISETVIVGWAHAARQFVSIEFSFHPYNI